MDAASGRVLYEKNAHERLPMASLTKIMTAFLTVENGDLDEKVKVSKYAASIPECSIYLEPGEVLTRRELLYAVMLKSANDASVALAESVAGSEKDFVKLMNKRAGELGLKDTHYVNPHGLDANGHYSSAYDLALLSRKALQNKVFAEIVRTKYKTIPWEGHDEDRALYNINRLLYRYEGTIGIKTGYTRKAGNCVVGAAQKGDMVLIAVSMNSPAVYDDLTRMLNYGFKNYKMFNIASKKQVFAEVKVNGGETETVKINLNEDLKVAATSDEIPYITYQITVPDKISAPVKKGEKIGECKLYLKDEEPLASVDMVAGETVSLQRVPAFVMVAKRIFDNWWIYFSGILVLLIYYKRKKNISLEGYLKQFLRWLLKRKIEQMKEKKRII
ncbi:MAG: D-alanyl-D-alanine carboxypeptidase [Thermosyntropha sp.]|nr:D-alanyl-D-alanine carboxypeptidase [Thermosyntropha sp.]